MDVEEIWDTVWYSALADIDERASPRFLGQPAENPISRKYTYYLQSQWKPLPWKFAFFSV